MSILKLNPRVNLGLILITLMAITFLALPSRIAPVAAPASPSVTLPIVAVHVSAGTETRWTYSDIPYFTIYEPLIEVLKSDGTPFVVVTDANIEAGDLLDSGSPKYPILFCLASECISDTAATQIESYVSAGGFVYVGSSSWTKYPSGSARSDFALSSQMGIKCIASPPSNWQSVSSATRSTSHRLVNHVPGGVACSWPLTVSSLWGTQTTTANPAEVLMTSSGRVMIATKPYNDGRFIYDAVLAHFSGRGATQIHTYSYIIFKEAVEWAFESCGIPLARLSPWKYQYDSAFIVRHDMCIQGGAAFDWMPASAQKEKDLGVVGEYYVVSGQVLDPRVNANPSAVADRKARLQSAYALGALIGTHNGGLNSTPWTGLTDPNAYAFYHWGPDDAVRSYPSQPYYARDSLDKSLDELESWLGVRPTIFVSPDFRGYLSQSLGFYEDLGIKTSGEQCIGQLPHMGLSMIEKNRLFDNLVLPPQEYLTTSGSLLQRMEEHSTATIQAAVDVSYGAGVLVNLYGHQSATTALSTTYITYSKSKPNMWATNCLELYDWWTTRQDVSTSPAYQILPTGEHQLTVTLAGSTSSDITLDVIFPIEESAVSNIQVQLDGTPSTDFRNTAAGVKVKAGSTSTVTITWKQQEYWKQTTQTEFESGTLTNLNTTSTPGQVCLASETVVHPISFSDDFSNPSWTSSNWNFLPSTSYWQVSGDGLCKRLPYNGWSYALAGNPSWTDYTVEARWKWVSGSMGGGISARMNPSSGARYLLWVYPSSYGPNKIFYGKYPTWTSGSGQWADTPTPTDHEWHTLRMELYGNRIKCYYDGIMVFDITDTSGPYTSGLIDFESFAGDSTTHYDWVTVNGPGYTTQEYESSGTLVSSPFDSGSNADWTQASWISTTPSGTQIKLRTRTASTQEGLASASWSDYYTSSPATITNPDNRWIQYMAYFETSDTTKTPVLEEVVIFYSERAWIESSSSSGPTDAFTPEDTVYILGGGYVSGADYNVYVVINRTWTEGMDIAPYMRTGSFRADSSGNIPPETSIWTGPLTPGHYDIIVDTNNDLKYQTVYDVLDYLDVEGAGFFVIPEYAIGTVLALTVCLAGAAIYKRSKRRNNNSE